MRVHRIDGQPGLARGFGHGGRRAVDQGGAAGHRLQHRQAEALVEARVGDGSGAGVERGQRRVLHAAKRAHGAVRDPARQRRPGFDAAPADAAGQHERRPATERRGQQCVRDRQTLQVLARLQGADGEDVARILQPVRGEQRRRRIGVHRAEGVAGGERRHGDAGAVEAVLGGGLVRGEGRDRHPARHLPERARHLALDPADAIGRMRRRVAPPDHVVHDRHRRAGVEGAGDEVRLVQQHHAAGRSCRPLGGGAHAPAHDRVERGSRGSEAGEAGAPERGGRGARRDRRPGRWRGQNARRQQASVRHRVDAGDARQAGRSAGNLQRGAADARARFEQRLGGVEDGGAAHAFVAAPSPQMAAPVICCPPALAKRSWPVIAAA